MKLPKHYFCLNDMTPQHEVEECIMQECESAGLDIREDEDLAEERGYDRAFEVVNPYKNKLEKIKKALRKFLDKYSWGAMEYLEEDNGIGVGYFDEEDKPEHVKEVNQLYELLNESEQKG